MPNQKNLVTIETWPEYLSFYGGSCAAQYVQANQDIIGALLQIQQESKSLEEFKENFEKFIVDREVFVEYANKNLP